MTATRSTAAAAVPPSSVAAQPPSRAMDERQGTAARPVPDAVVDALVRMI
ncbi:hypothetical protein GV792_17170 [Nocardia cyriacigeorgica]|nr:hypothetical protein [Nocardia cyriacigeorgica]NEW40431.1 hypothetical protein [Nocardia cyriacigeorgica]NEW51774.1 hypothetical protein [Nocardia cyriacigeorgica]